MSAALLGLGVIFSLPSHADNGVLISAGMGAALGAVVGHQINHDSGAWVGGAVGAVTGAAIANSNNNNNNVRYIERDPYYNNAYNGNVRRDVYVVDQYDSYRRPPVNVIYVDDDRGYGNHRGHHYPRGYVNNRQGNGYYNNVRQQPRTVVVVR